MIFKEVKESLQNPSEMDEFLKDTKLTKVRIVVVPAVFLGIYTGAAIESILKKKNG